MLCRLPAGDGKGNGRGIAQRLFHVLHDIRDNVKIVLRCNAAAAVAAPQNVSRLFCQAGLVKPGFIISAGIRHLHIGYRQHIGGIHAAGQEGVSLLLRILDLRHNGLQCRVDLIRPFIEGPGLIRREGRRIIPCDTDLSVRLPDQVPAGHQFFNALEEGILARNIGQAEVDLEHVLIQLLLIAGFVQDVPDHGPVQELSVLCQCIVKGLCPEGVAEAEKLLLLPIPQGKGEHAMQMHAHLMSPFLISLLQQEGLPLFPGHGLHVRQSQFPAECSPVSDVSSIGSDFYHSYDSFSSGRPQPGPGIRDAVSCNVILTSFSAGQQAVSSQLR